MEETRLNSYLSIRNNLPPWLKEDFKKQPKSTSFVETELRIHGTEEMMKVPLQTSTVVYDLKCMLAVKLGCDPGRIQFVTKQGCTWRMQMDTEECRRKIWVKGIKSFSREKMKYQHPLCIIGAGHAGLRQAMYFLKYKEYNFVLYDRKPEVGCTSWFDQANKTSKLQTELGTYHLQYDEDNPVPTNMCTWPSRDDLLRHFKEVAEEYGIMPYCKMLTNVKHIEVNRPTPQQAKDEMSYYGKNWATQTYRLVLEKTDGSDEGEFESVHANIIMYPGNLTIPRREAYKGEETFGGLIHYAICDDVDYTKVTGVEVALVGHGAFAVENVRTCLEFDCKKVYMICRRKNLACPRVASWLVNQSAQAISAALYMRVTEPMYNLIGFDPWTYHCVHTNEKRTSVNVVQKARFGIGDVYFLALAMGMLEIVHDKVKRLSKHTIHLDSGAKLENVPCLLKLLGFNGNFDVDRLLQIRTMSGYWVDDDFRRWILAEPIGVNATNFGGTSFSPGVRGWVELSAHFMWFPSDWAMVRDSGMMPKHSAEPENDRPAYVIDARHATTTGISLGGMIVAFQESGAVQGPLKRRKQLECHPMKKYVDECTAEWNEYAKRWKENGAPKDIPPYPYTYKNVQEYLNEEIKEIEAAQARMAARS